jgi:hypothetical protein
MQTKLLRIAVIGWLLIVSTNTNAQNVGINTSGSSANCNALLDLNTGNTFNAANANRGLLVPNISLSSSTSQTNFPTGICSIPDGLLVYNTNSSMTGGWIGYWYWSAANNKWNALLDNNAPGGAWTIVGNAGTTAGTNFLGTTDAQDMVFKANNSEAMRIANTTGYVGINNTAPAARLDVIASSGNHAIYGHTPNTGAYLGYESSITFGTTPQTLNGGGVYATNPLAGYVSFFCQSSGAATVAAGINYSNVWIAQYSYVDNASTAFNPSASYSQLNVTAPGLGGIQTSIEGFTNRGTTTGNPGYAAAVLGIVTSQSESSNAIMGIAYTNAATYSNTCVDCGGFMSSGGYFELDNYAATTNNVYAYVAANENGTAKKIVGSGSVSEIVPTPTHGRVTLICPESPEYWYQDYGTVKLVSGKAHVELDPILADVIFVTDSNPIRVFCTPVDMLYFNGVAITNRTQTGFDIIELNGGTHSGSLDYQVIAKPRTNYGEGRFAQAPGPVGAPTEHLGKAKAKNQVNPANIWHWQPDNVVYGYTLPKHEPKSVKKTEQDVR